MPRKKSQRSSWGCNEPARRDGYRRLRFWADLHDGRGYRRCSMTVKGSKRRGDEVLRDMWAKHSDEGLSADVTVGRAYDEWWLPAQEAAVERGSLSANSLKAYRGTWSRGVEQRWGGVRAGDVLHEDVQEWLLGLTLPTARACRSILRGVLEKCVSRGLIQRNVLKDDYAMPRQAPSARASARRSLSLDELRRLWSVMWGEPCEAAFILGAFGSCRAGESLGVLAREVVYGESECGVPVAVCPVSRQVDSRTGAVTDRLKNVWSYRTAVVAGPMATRLHEIACAAVERGETWLCDDGTARPMSQKSLRNEIARASGRAGIARATPQILRPSWETSVARWTLGLDSEVIEKLMGHVGTGVTGRHYDRPGATEFVRAVSGAYAAHPFADAWFDGEPGRPPAL